MNTCSNDANKQARKQLNEAIDKKHEYVEQALAKNIFQIVQEALQCGPKKVKRLRVVHAWPSGVGVIYNGVTVYKATSPRNIQAYHPGKWEQDVKELAQKITRERKQQKANALADLRYAAVLDSAFG